MTTRPAAQRNSNLVLALPPADARRGRRWIRRRLAQLDAERDYAEIFKLSTVFNVTGFIADWGWAQLMCRATTGHSSKAIAREGTGKLLTNPDRRYDDTNDHFFVWAEFGPESVQAKRSVDIINALHGRWQKTYPSAFDDLDLWAYVIALEACGVDRLLIEHLGFPEPDEKTKVAKVKWARKLAELFVYIDGRLLSEVMPDLETWEDCVEFLRQYESQPRHATPDANSTACALAVTDAFQKRHKLPRPLAQALVTSFWHDATFACTGIARPSRFWGWAARNYMRTALILSGLRPDSTESVVEKLRRRSAASGEPLRPVLRAAIQADAKQSDPERDAGGSGCPMGFSAPSPDAENVT